MCTDSNVVQLFFYSRYTIFLQQVSFKLSQLGLKLPWSRCYSLQKCLECLNLAKTIKWKLKSRAANGIAKNLECTSTFQGFFFFHTSRREDSQKYLKENASSMPVQFSWSKNKASSSLILASSLGSFSGEFLKVFHFKTPQRSNRWHW